ncbi:hypothetical protein UK23_39200 [Lentzea aerocolonigenes]|uniref:Uncharacterized protein n=1 Tax=Lentzea aerocolonigenes TaxID=68170 RepID=A0A0F0GHP5_LENAE|nr:hypothetical protein UK23_39200 [Lentzea aerocolonigenes]
MRADVRSFSDKASLEFSLLDGDLVAPRYELTYSPQAPVVLSEVRLTPSVVAHIRGALDRPFVLSAGPEADGDQQRAGERWAVAGGREHDLVAVRGDVRRA